MRLFLAPLILTAAVFTFGASAIANEKARADMLARDHQKCVLGCVMSNEGKVCQVLCDCTVDKFADLPFTDYVRLQIGLNSGHVNDEQRTFLDDMALSCAAEVDAKFPQLRETPEVDEEAPELDKDAAK